MAFALATFRFVRPLFALAETRGVAGQLLDSATAVAANYRAATHARSPKEWRAKLGLVVEESDESTFWLEFIHKAELRMEAGASLLQLSDEAQQLTRIFGAALRTSRQRETERRRDSVQQKSLMQRAAKE